MDLDEARKEVLHAKEVLEIDRHAEREGKLCNDELFTGSTYPIDADAS